jgi:UDPglucose 6-dehydrogenase
MKIGFIGLGKLGLPCALAIDSVGHKVYAYDVNQNIEKYLKDRTIPYKEEGANDLLKKHDITWSTLCDVVTESEIIFVSIQTPHDSRYEGITRLPEERVDFDYTYLTQGLTTLSQEIERQGREKIVIVISTVLPGTISRLIEPILSPLVRLCYNPFFIAMGTTIKDFMSPEFVLFGVKDEGAYEIAKSFYATLHQRPIYRCTIEEAELIKVSYNTFITMKICLANTIMEVSHKLENIDCEVVMGGLFLAKERLISPKYLIGGMGDGGGCHPRDNIALSWLAKSVDLSYDWYESLMVCREKQTEWLSELMLRHKGDLPMVILGKTFKKETNLVTGSPAILLKNILEEKGHQVISFDPHVDEGEPPLHNKALFFVATNHDIFKDYKFPNGSVIIDPWRFIPPGTEYNVISIGRSKNNLGSEQHHP